MFACNEANKEITKEDIEQLKRDLYSYGYYTKCIDEVKAKLYDVSQRLKDRERVQGISFGEKVGNSDPYHPSIAALIYEEEGLQIELKELENKRSTLGLDVIEEYLTSEEFKIITAHFFDRLSYSYIQANMSYSYDEKVKRITKIGLKKILKKL